MRKQGLDLKHRLHFGWSALDTRLSSSVESSDTQLSVSRIVLAFGLLVFDALLHYGWTDRLPVEFFDPPPGLPRLVFALPIRLPLSVLDGSIRLLCLGLMLGMRPRFTGPLMAFAILYSSSFIYSIGKIDHDYHILAVALFCLGWGSDWGRGLAWLPDPPRTVRRDWGLKLLALSIGIGMFTAGYGKALSWIDMDTGTSGFLAWYGDSWRRRENVFGSWIGQLHPVLLEAVDYITVLLELTPLPMILLGRRWWLGWLVAANLFHLGVFLALKISFLPQSLTYLAFNRWSAHDDGVRAFFKNKKNLYLLAISGILISVLSYGYDEISRRPLTILAFAAVFAMQIRGMLIERGATSTMSRRMNTSLRQS